MNRSDNFLIKKSIFFIDKYFFPKLKRVYFIRALIGVIVFWIYEFEILFGSVTQYKKMMSDLKIQINNSEVANEQLEYFFHNPLFIMAMIGWLIFSFIIGYFIMTIAQVIIDIIRGNVFKDFDSSKKV
ncbi:hypothetical protein ID741_003885 [Enterococcus sp. AZ103]